MEFLLGLNGEPIADRVSHRFAGVGLIRGEYLCRRAGVYITDPECQALVGAYVGGIADLFAPDPVWYRLIEMETSEINTLRGADRPVHEKTTMLGLRGVRRALRYRDTFRIEGSIIAAAAKTRPNLHVLLPFVHDPGEVEEIRALLAGLGYTNGIGIMAEIPAAILCLRDFLSVGVTNITVGINDLTSLTLGAYRGSGYDVQTHPGVRRLLAMAREETAGSGVPLAIAGYISRALLDLCNALAYDAAVLHYSKLSDLWGEAYVHLPHRVDLDAIKRKIRARVQKRSQS